MVETLGTPEVFPQPGGDIALSPDGQWFVNGHSDAGNNYYTVLRRADGAWARTAEMSRGKFTGGDLRIDGAPAWNRTSDAILFPGLDPTDGTRQIFVIQVRGTSVGKDLVSHRCRCLPGFEPAVALAEAGQPEGRGCR